LEIIFELRNVSFRYPDGSLAINDVSLQIFKGEKVVIIGSNGSGKSTLLMLLANLIKPTKGEIFFKGEKIDKIAKEVIRKDIGIVFQDPSDQLFNPTVLDEIVFSFIQLGYSKEESIKKAGLLLEQFGLKNYYKKPPHRLSFGEKKLLAFLTIVAWNSSIMLLDEPLANVDYSRVKKILSMINDFSQKGKTLISATQAIEYIPYFGERIIVLKDGKVLYDTTIEDLINKPEKLINAGLRPIKQRDFPLIL